jgi:hypothetical protein
LNVLELLDARWGGHNSWVNEANIRSIDLANGGGAPARLASAPPSFRPVLQYEAGRAPLIADGDNGMRFSPRFGGFIRNFFNGR